MSDFSFSQDCPECGESHYGDDCYNFFNHRVGNRDDAKYHQDKDDALTGDK